MAVDAVEHFVRRNLCEFLWLDLVQAAAIYPCPPTQAAILLMPPIGIMLEDHARKSIPVEACGHLEKTALLFSS